MVEAAEVASIYNVIEVQMEGQIGSKATAKVTEEVLASVGRYWTEPNN